MNKVTLGAVAAALVALVGVVQAQGIERTARPVVDPTRDLERMRMVPTCAPGTPVAVSGTRFVCGAFVYPDLSALDGQDKFKRDPLTPIQRRYEADYMTKDEHLNVVAKNSCKILYNRDYEQHQWMVCPRGYYVAGRSDNFDDWVDIICCPFK